MGKGIGKTWQSAKRSVPADFFRLRPSAILIRFAIRLTPIAMALFATRAMHQPAARRAAGLIF